VVIVYLSVDVSVVLGGCYNLAPFDNLELR